MITPLDDRDNPITAIERLASGNVGATTVLAELLSVNPVFVMWVDQAGMRGKQIWTLYRNVCKCNIVLTIGLINAVHAGIVSHSLLMKALEGKVTFTAKQLKEFMNNLYGSAGV
jgi:hypothetical protein